MTGSVTWMRIGHHASVNATIRSPSTLREAAGLAGYKATGPSEIRPVEITGQLRTIRTEDGPQRAYATTYNGHPLGASRMRYDADGDGRSGTTQITGFLAVDYRLTTPDNAGAEHAGVLIQMRNGDLFFRPSLDGLPGWSHITALHSVEILRASPLPSETFVAQLSYRPAIRDLEIMCFAAGTLIRTAQGPRAVETLQPGDMVWTRDHGCQPLRWIGQRRLEAGDLAAAPMLRPIRIAPGALGPGRPARTLRVSRQHRILIRAAAARGMFGTEEVLAPACQLTGLPGIAVDTRDCGVTYVHLMFDAHEVLMSEGAETESLFPGPQAIRAMGAAAMAEIEAIFPGLLGADTPPAPARAFVRGATLRRLLVHEAGA